MSLISNWSLDSETYHLKLEGYKKRQREITSDMKAHVNADGTCLITAKTVLDLAKRTKEIFINSKMPEKHQLLNFVFSNLKLDEKKLLVTLREPFLTLCAMSHQPVNLGSSIRTTVPFQDVCFEKFHLENGQQIRVSPNNSTLF